MPPQQAITILTVGAALIAFGLIPGPLARLRDELQRCRSAFSPMPVQALPSAPGVERLPGQTWLAAGGAAVVIAVFLITFFT